MFYECLGCFYFGKVDAPESEDVCLYFPTEDDKDDLPPPCMRVDE